MANKENLPPALPPQQISGISPSNKPALSRQRDHSACRRPETPLRVKKTRDNLKQNSTYTDIPPPCIHAQHEYTSDFPASTNQAVRVGQGLALDNGSEAGHGGRVVHTLHSFNAGVLPPAHPSVESISAIPALQRQKSASRRMLSKVKQGITNRTKISQSNRVADSETNSLRRVTNRRKQSCEIDERATSFEICRDSIDSTFAEGRESAGFCTSGARSFTNSTVSTAEVFGDRPAVGILRTASSSFEKPFALDLPQANRISFSTPLPPSPPKPTPRPLRPDSRTIQQPAPQTLTLKVPYVELEVISDCTTLDVHAKRDVWIAITATVRGWNAKVGNASIHNEMMASIHRSVSDASREDELDSSAQEQALGIITSMRVCFKPMGNCRIRDVVGRKSMKDVTIGHTCSLFIRLHVPRIRAGNAEVGSDQESLLTELESIIGILETDVLHVEARYRHSLFPSDNVISVRHICKMRRPQIASRWSIMDGAEYQLFSSEAQRRLARYLASECSAEQALELIQYSLDATAKDDIEVCEIRKELTDKVDHEKGHGLNESRPSVVVTDIDWDPNISSLPVSDQFSTAPSTPVAESGAETLPLLPNGVDHAKVGSKSFLAPSILALPLISTPKTTTALARVTSPSEDTLKLQAGPSSTHQDTARQLWRHIRHSSLSTKQLETITSERLEHLEASDDSLKELRRRALANKRSVGAETLKGWRWEEEMRAEEYLGEAPWM